MISEQFKNEIKEYIDKQYEEFLAYQSTAKDIFKEFASLCDKNEIPYYMAYGSLLGVVRDKGNIPWDYDIDVAVPITYREKLLEALRLHLDENYYYVYKDNVPNYPTSCLRICRRGIPFISIHIDIFFLIGCPDDERKREKFKRQLLKLERWRGIKYSYDWFSAEAMPGIKYGALNILRVMRRALIPSGFINNMEEQLFNKYSLSHSDYMICAGDMRYQVIYNVDDYKHPVRKVCEDLTACIPNGYENILRSIYGDYNVYPPICDRFEEFYKMTRIVKERNIQMESSKKFRRWE